MSSDRYNMKRVDSSALEAVGYDPETKVLRVRFPSGAIWDYEGVSQAAFDTFMAAPSLGKYFAKSIKGTYLSERAN